MMKAIRNTKGFSLLELLVSLAILSVGMLGLLGMQITGAQGNASSQKLTIATTLAQTGIEDFMSRSSGSAILNNSANGDYLALNPNTPNIFQGITYNVTYSICPDDLDCNGTEDVEGVTRIDVTVSGGGRTVTFTSFKRTI